MELVGFGFDIEADNLYLQSKKIWTIHFKSFDGRKIKINPFLMTKEEFKKEIEDWLNSFDGVPFVITHNGFGFDLWMLWKFAGIPFIKGYKGKDYIGKKQVILIDTLPMSQFIDPDRFGGHSLEELSKEHGSHKIDFRQKLIDIGYLEKTAPKGAEFQTYHPLMEEYCEQDVEADIKIFFGLVGKMKDLYGDNWQTTPFH